MLFSDLVQLKFSSHIVDGCPVDSDFCSPKRYALEFHFELRHDGYS